jgi:hypothetical protein
MMYGVTVYLTLINKEERIMKGKLIKLSLIAAFAAMIWTCVAVAETENEALYGNVVDQLIDNCQKKGPMLDSEHENIRKDAAISLMKASFYQKNKELLIADMIENGVELKEYKITHFLNERFFSKINQNDSGIAEAYSEPDEVTVPTSSK